MDRGSWAKEEKHDAQEKEMMIWLRLQGDADPLRL